MKSNQLVLFVWFFLGLISFSYNAVADCGGYIPPGNDNWVINESDVVACSNMEIIMNGNLTVKGILQMTNVTLRMNTSNGSYVHINNTGSFEIIFSRVEKAGNDNYLFWNRNPILLEITGSNISGCGINTSEEMNRGLYIEGDNFLLSGNGFRDNFAAIIIDGDDSVIDGNVFSGNKIDIEVTGDGDNFTSNRIESYGNGLFFTGNGLFIFDNSFSHSTIDVVGSGLSFLNNTIDSGGLYADVDSSLIGNNTITGCGIGLRLGTTTDSYDNIVKDNFFISNTYGIYVDSNAKDSLFSGNRIQGNASSVAGVYLKGIENVFDNNIIQNNDRGILVTDSNNCNITGSILKDNKFGVLSEKTASLLIKDSIIENNTNVDIDVLSTSLILNNANYTTMFRNWTLIIQAFDSVGARVNFSMMLDSNVTSLSFTDDSVGGENVTLNVPEIFENKNLEDSVTEYNPYLIYVSNPSIGFHSSYLNITSDRVHTVDFTGTYNDTYNPPSTFLLTVISPGNRTYLEGDLINGSLPAEVRSNENLTGCVYVLNDESAKSMVNTGLKSYTVYIPAGDFQSGMNKIYFSCNGPAGLHNISDVVYLTVYADRGCLTHDGCLDTQFCRNYECEDIECACGAAINHECSPYECCSDDVCQTTEQCVNHQCKPVSCECSEKISNHKCVIPSGYCCKSTMCTNPNEICDPNLNKCVERTLTLYLSTTDAVVGEELRITVKDMQGVAVGDADITANFASGNKITAKTNADGEATITLPEAGDVNVVVRKSGYAAAGGDIVVREGFNILIVIIIVVIGIGASGAFLYLRSSGGLKKEKPVTMKKIIQGNNVILSVKNNTKDSMRDIIINDQIPHGAFITSNMRPSVTKYDANTDNLSWEFLTLEAGQEVSITYQTYKSMEGFAVRIGDKEYISE